MAEPKKAKARAKRKVVTPKKLARATLKAEGEFLEIDCPCEPVPAEVAIGLSQFLTDFQAYLASFPQTAGVVAMRLTVIPWVIPRIPNLLGCCNPCKDVPDGKLYLMACKGGAKALVKGSADGQILKWDNTAQTWVLTT